jgi:hypothetical protein
MKLLSIVLISFVCSAMVFAAHAFPLNEKVIEPAMIKYKGSWGPYIAGFFYYAVALFLPLALFLSHAS